jgi:hypothetical protein
MKVKLYWICIAAGVAIFLGVFTGVITIAQEPDRAQIQQEFRNRLSESDGIAVVVEVVGNNPPTTQSLTKQVQEDVELELRNSGVKILTKDELEYAPGHPRLGVYLVVFKEPTLKDVYIYSFRVIHFEDATLYRNNRYAEGVCWDSGLYIGREKTFTIRRTVKTYVLKYINDYLAANPKQTQESSDLSRY